MIRVVVVDDEELVRDGFALILGAQADMEVVGQASTGVEAIDVCQRAAPDVVLMDIQMPELDGLDATQRILRTSPATKILVLTTFALDDYVVRALRSGASGFLLKDSPRSSLLAAVRSVAAGDVMVDADVMRSLVDLHLGGRPADRPPHPALARMTPRETEVMRKVAQGMSNGEIASALHISETTVKTHVARLLAKWDARDRIRLVVLAHESGLQRD